MLRIDTQWKCVVLRIRALKIHNFPPNSMKTHSMHPKKIPEYGERYSISYKHLIVFEKDICNLALIFFCS